MKNCIYYAGLLFVAMWLFILHSAFAIAIIPIFLAKEFYSELFLIAGIDLKAFFPYVFGLVFSIAITGIIAVLRKSDKYFWKFAIGVAILELFAFMLICMPNHGIVWQIAGAIYYGIYFFFVIIFYMYIKPENKSFIDNIDQNIANKFHVSEYKLHQDKNYNNAINEIDLHQKVFEMIKKGKKGIEIASELNIHPSKVSRIKKAIENNTI